MSQASESVVRVRNSEKAPTTNKVAEAAHDAIDDTADRAEKVETDVRRKAAVAGRKLEKSQKKATQQVEASVDRIESYVRERPFAAAGVAFVAGVVATAFLRR